MRNGKLGIAVVGAGYAARNHLRWWKARDDVRIAGIYDVDRDRARTVGAELGIESFADLDALLGRGDVDAVDIATSTRAHLEVAKLAAAHKKTVLCQKPMASTYEDAQAIVQACDAAGVRLMVNENWRWRPWYRTAKEVIAGGKLGNLAFLSLSYSEPRTIEGDPENLPDRKLDARGRPMAGRKILLFGGPHQLDVARFLFGEPTDVFARGAKVTSGPSAEELATVSLGYPDRIGHVEMHWATVGPQPFQPDRLTVSGTKGTLQLEKDGRFYVDYPGGKVENLEVDATDYYARSWGNAIEHFVDCMTNDQPFETSGADNLRTLAVLFAAYRSMEEKRAIPV